MAATSPPSRRKAPRTPQPATEPAAPEEPASPPQDEEGDTRSELDRLAPDPQPLTLKDGTEIQVKDLATREFLSLMRILTRGAGHLLAAIMSQTTDSEEMFGQLLGILIIAVPEAQEETITFLRQMVEPSGIQNLPKEAQIKSRANLWDKLENPRMGDSITIIEAILERERDDIIALGKRLAAALTAATNAKMDLTKI
jgi:hypothetical protein